MTHLRCVLRAPVDARFRPTLTAPSGHVKWCERSSKPLAAVPAFKHTLAAMLARVEQVDALDRVVTSPELTWPARRHEILDCVLPALRVRHDMIQARSGRENQPVASVVRAGVAKPVGEKSSHTLDRPQIQDRCPAPPTVPSVPAEYPTFSEVVGHASDLAR
jgi:hypothetical protein